ncbi:hypothetical protein L3X38_023067 [Prunus dulcis]|uniref:F-box domain-containing protein n=1 Tax=Prunus dulcis TaxID=3755 RepID=A0AAD4VYA4_PRUDU|nr:hypothetical protein L3X38_023067 [Prunus dulcis]
MGSSQSKPLILAKKPKPQAIVTDRISELPDAVLCHILSFLPTKLAVRTSILSTRWKNIWASVHNLDFDDEYDPWIERDDSFSMFVDRVLSFRDSADIHKFRLHCSGVKDFSRIDGWIRTAIDRNAVEFDLRVYSYSDFQIFELPQSLFMSKTLVVLKLNSDCLRYVPPKSGCFPSLKFLHVTGDYPDDESIEKLFYCCPVLEDLTIDGVVRHDADVYISAPELKTLRISLSGEDFSPQNSFSINAPKLEKLYVMENGLSNYIVKNPKSLVKAIVNLYSHYSCLHRDFSKFSSALLAGISNVKYLSLSAHLLKACSVPAFDNLSELKLVLHNCDNWELLTELLKRSPNLEYLVLEHNEVACTIYSDDEEYFAEYFDHEWNTPETVPVCLSAHLKSITIRGFKGDSDEMEAAKYLLEKGKVLNKVTIYAGDLLCRREELDKELELIRRGSRTCRVEFF